MCVCVCVQGAYLDLRVFVSRTPHIDLSQLQTGHVRSVGVADVSLTDIARGVQGDAIKVQVRACVCVCMCPPPTPNNARMLRVVVLRIVAFAHLVTTMYQPRVGASDLCICASLSCCMYTGAHTSQGDLAQA